MSFGLPERGIVPLVRVDARLEERHWPFAEAHAGRIARRWAERVAEKPALFNGRVLRQSRGRIVDGVFEATYSPCDYAAFIEWLGDSALDPMTRNGFAMAALRAADGAFLLGVMGGHTISAGKAYFPAGTPDMGDVTADGRVDLSASALRELSEETGLAPGEFTAGTQVTAVFDGPRIAFMWPVRIDLPGSEARRLILERLARQAAPELADILVVRGPGDLDPSRMPAFMVDFLRAAFGHVEGAPACAPRS